MPGPGPQAPRRRGQRERGLRALPRRHRPRVARLVPPAEPPRSRLPAGPRRRAQRPSAGAATPPRPTPSWSPGAMSSPSASAASPATSPSPASSSPPRTPTTRRSRAPASSLTPLRRSFAFAHTGGCAGCHEFRFPMPGGDDDASSCRPPRASTCAPPRRTKPCADCHMPLREGHRSHAFAEVRDEAWLRASLAVTVERSARRHAPFHAHPDAPRARLPHGRSLPPPRGRLRALGETARSSAARLRHLARHFELVPGLPGRQLTRDDRVQGEPAVVVLELPTRSEMPTITRHLLVGELPARGHRRAGDEPGRRTSSSPR
jgi:hypothetical protein